MVVMLAFRRGLRVAFDMSCSGFYRIGKAIVMSGVVMSGAVRLAKKPAAVQAALLPKACPG
jgi:hypothetical protein